MKREQDGTEKVEQAMDEKQEQAKAVTNRRRFLKIGGAVAAGAAAIYAAPRVTKAEAGGGLSPVGPANGSSGPSDSAGGSSK